MKRKLFLLSFLSVVTIALFTVSCETEPVEHCEQEEICDGHEVTACCTDDNGAITCVYKYNGKEYTEDQLDELSEDLGCTNTSAIVLKSTDCGMTIEDVKMKLVELMELTHAGLRSDMEMR